MLQYLAFLYIQNSNYEHLHQGTVKLDGEGKTQQKALTDRPTNTKMALLTCVQT